VKGKLGYMFKRGREKDSLENQIAAFLSLPILYNSYVKICDIERDFDVVVVATGTTDFAKERGIFSNSLNIFARTATIIGNFEASSVRMWLNNEYAKNGFAYVMPFSTSEARVTLMINNISNRELEFYWKEFLRTEGIEYKMTETRDLEHNLGFVDPVKMDNIYFIGDAAGLTDDFIGFGAISAVESGFMAARDIANNLDYLKSIKPYIDHRTKLHELRKTLNAMDNRELDRLLMFLGLPVIKQFVYNNPMFKVKRAAVIARAFNSLNRG
ncbi:MAG: dehydrogenase, partial [Bacillota bacterium]